jgi:hypothetical protein
MDDPDKYGIAYDFINNNGSSRPTPICYHDGTQLQVHSRSDRWTNMLHVLFITSGGATASVCSINPCSINPAVTLVAQTYPSDKLFTRACPCSLVHHMHCCQYMCIRACCCRGYCYCHQSVRWGLRCQVRHQTEPKTNRNPNPTQPNATQPSPM